MKLHIEMFGEFTIYVDGEKNFQYEGRTRKLWNLLQYLLVNRNRPVPQAELFSIAHLDGKKGKPENSLKNLIYRLRGLLEESDLPKEDYILCRRGAYQWNPEISVTLDIEVLNRNIGRPWLLLEIWKTALCTIWQLWNSIMAFFCQNLRTRNG